ncbi:MAG: metal-dependent hydrolase [Phycisphaerae bacterium]|nr:MAG: metal-dependent hydrolase [Phycisphaerae bacterium]
MSVLRAASLCVLSSSSGGNCSALLLERDRGRSLVLFDAGLSPRRTRLMLREAGVEGVPIEAIVLTHLDRDHWNPGWLGRASIGTCVYLHASHRGRAVRDGVLHPEARLFAEPFEPTPGVEVASVVMSHDEAGVAAFRVAVRGLGTLGYATDVGRVTPGLIDHLADVEVLAIESNYCRAMQVASNRPAYLKARIMGGSGHLSNAESAAAVAEIRPRRQTVLLHLSRECNTPQRAAEAHAHGPAPLTIARPDRPTGWVPLMPSPGAVVVRRLAAERTLFAPP